MKKKLLVLNGSHSDIPLILGGKKLGFEVITLGNDSSMIGHKYADKHFDVDFSDEEAVCECAKKEKINYICACANDFGYISACYTAEKLGLPGHDNYETCLQLHHKDKFKMLVDRYNLLSPKAKGFDNEKEAIEYAESKKNKIIIKPIDLSGGKGVIVIENINDKAEAIHNAFKLSKHKRIVVEDFIEGTNHCFSVFLINKKVYYYFTDNEYYYKNPFLCCTSLGPIEHLEKVEKKLIEQSEKIAEILNLVDGRFHIQYRLDKDENPWIIEISRRMSGDFYSYPVNKALGIDDSMNILRAECGLDLSNILYRPKQKGYVGRHCLMTPRNGIIESYEISDELKQYVFDEFIWFTPNYEIKDYMKDKFGVIFYDFHEKIIADKFIPSITNYIKINYK